MNPSQACLANNQYFQYFQQPTTNQVIVSNANHVAAAEAVWHPSRPAYSRIVDPSITNDQRPRTYHPAGTEAGSVPSRTAYSGGPSPSIQGCACRPAYPRVSDPSIPTTPSPQCSIADASGAPGNKQLVNKKDASVDPILAFINKDRNNWKGKRFSTEDTGALPPLVTTQSSTDDKGNCAPRFIRSSLYTVPTKQKKLDESQLAFNLVITPFARSRQDEHDPPIVTSEKGHLQCSRCKAHMSRLMKFIREGRAFKCLLCKEVNNVPDDYFMHLKDGVRADKLARKELHLGAYEFDLSIDAMPEFFRDRVVAKVPAFIFVMDVSYSSVQSGQVSLICRQMKDILATLAEDGGVKARVGFITYNDHVHLYSIDPESGLRMHVIGGVGDVGHVAPQPCGFVVHAGQSEALIDELMSRIPGMFSGGGTATATVLAPAIQAGVQILKAAGCAGKLLVFTSSLPGDRDLQLSSTDQTQFYQQLGTDCSQLGCSVDVFATGTSFMDLATIGQVARMSAGQVNKYAGFVTDGWRFLEDVKRSISSTMAFDAIMDVRTSSAITTDRIFGHLMPNVNGQSHLFSSRSNIHRLVKDSGGIRMAALDPDKSITVELKHEDELEANSDVHIQVSLLYTSVAGRRRMRVFNLSLNACTTLPDMYAGCDLDTVMNLMLKQSVANILDESHAKIRHDLLTKAKQMLATISGERVKMLPLYIKSLLNCAALTGGGSVDDRSLAMYAVATMSVAQTNVYLYPRLVAVHNMEPGYNKIPPRMRCSKKKLNLDGAYILENGIDIFLWIGPDAVDDLKRDVDFCVRAENNGARLDQLMSCRSREVWSVITKMRSSRRSHMRLVVVVQDSELSSGFAKFLVEDNVLPPVLNEIVKNKNKMK